MVRFNTLDSSLIAQSFVASSFLESEKATSSKADLTIKPFDFS